VPWIDEDQNPLTGEWLARALKIRKKGFYERGEHYNHSGYADLLITGLAGLRPRADHTVEVNPLLPAGQWDWFCLDAIPYHGRVLTIVWDKRAQSLRRARAFAFSPMARKLRIRPRSRKSAGICLPAAICQVSLRRRRALLRGQPAKWAVECGPGWSAFCETLGIPLGKASP